MSGMNQSWVRGAGSAADMQREVHRALLNVYVPAGVVVNEGGEVL